MMIDSKIESANAGKSVTLIGAVANGLLILLKFTAGIFGQSQALVADAVHSIGFRFAATQLRRGKTRSQGRNVFLLGC